MTKEKTKSIIFAGILAVLAVALIAIFAVQEFKKSGTIVDKEVKEMMKDFDKYYNSKERTVIYYASSECGYCKLQTPILETIAEDYDMDYIYIDSAKLPTKQRNEVLKKLDIEQATPTTVIVENGKVIDKAVGYTQGTDYVKFFVDNEMIPEDAVYSKEANLTFIDYPKYEELVATKEANVIVIGQTTCSHCIAIKPALNAIAGEYDLTINYLNLTEMQESEYNSLIESLKKLKYDEKTFVEEGTFGTPLILVVKNGKVDTYLAGERSKSQLVKFFKKAKLIK